MLYIICCIGGKTVKLKVNIDIWLVLKRFLFGKTSPAIPLCFSVMKLRLSVISFSLAAAESRIENRLIFKSTGIDFNCPIEWNTSAPKPIQFNCDSYLENYMDRLFNFTTFIKTKQKNPSSYQNTFNQKSYSFLNNFDMCKPKVGTIQTVYFFEYFKSRKTKKRNVTNYPKKWNYTSQNAAAYPIWTIKRSKYYSVPQSKTKEQEALERQAEETEEPSKLVEADSLENATGSHNEIHMQISEVSVHSKRSRENDVLETESDKLKTEIKRKVSFRDEVDISGGKAETQDVEPQNCNVLPVPSEDHQNYVDDAELPLDKSPSSGSQKNLNKLSSRISDLLMTDSLMQLANEIPKRDKKKLKMAAQKSSPKNLKLTDSAKTVLAKLSKSFGDLEYTSGSGTLETDLVPQFYDEKGNPIVEVFNKDGDLLFSLKDDPIGDLATVLFDSNGLLLKNRYDAHGNRIRAVYDENAKVIRRISLINDEIKGVQADLETVEYYDHRGKPIKHLYDSSGYEIKTVGNDLTSRIFDADGRIRMEIYTRRGRRIDAVYDSRGRLLARVSDSQLIPCGRREQVRVAEMDADSLSKLFDCGSKSEDPKSENENSEKRNESPKRLYDQEGNPLIGVYDKKGRPIKLTSSGEADELLPFLFDNKGKLQSKRYDSKGKELKAVFGEDGKVISGMSIAWLNELLANSENEHATSKKKGSFFKRIYKSKSKTGKRYDIEKLYDSNGKIITSIFDSKGKPLAISLSGDATKLLPSLFGNGGKFIKRRFDSEKKRIRCVYGRDGNVISAISVTYLNRVTEKLKSEQNQEKTVDEPIIDNKKDWSCPQETVESMMTDTKTIKSLECADKIPVHLYDQDGNLLTDILDEDGNVLVSTDSGNAWKLLPHLFDEKGKFVEKLYDKKGNELSTVYNKDGKNLNECLSVAMKITTDEEPLESLETGKDNDISVKEYNNNVNEEEEKFEEKVKINENPKHESRNEHKHNKNKRTKKSKPKEPDLEPAKKESSAGFYELSVIENMSSPSKHVELNTVEQKHEDKQLKPTISITKKQSVNQNIDIPEEAPKAGDSIYRFFDQRGNQITEVYDHKGRALVKTKSGDVEQLAKYIFDKKGFLSNNIYDHKGRRITHIFDQKKRSISRISVPSIVSDEKLSNKQHRRSKGISGCIYDKDGNLIKEIYDRRGNLLIITKLVKFKDLAPIIFDDKGVRRRLYDKSGYEIGPVFDYKGKLLKNIPGYKKPKRKIYSISGKPLRNFYDSDGSLIIALYNDYGKTLCSVKKGTNNVELLSKFFFDKEGHFFKERFYNYRGEMIRHVYDSECNIVRSIKRTESRRIAHHKCTKYGGEKLSQKKNAGSANKLNVKINFASRHKQRGYHGKSEVRPVENITGTFSQSDTMLNPGKPLIQRSMSAYSIRDYPVQQEGAESLSSSASSLTDVSVKKFYDENGRLLTGVYNSKTRLLGYSASGNARVLAPYLFDMKGNFISGRYNLDRKFLKHIYDSNGKLVDKISKHVLDKNKEHRKTLRDFKFHDRNGDVVTSVYNLRDDKILKAKDSNEKAPKSVDKKGKPKKKFYNRRGSKVKTNEDQEIVAKESSAEIISDHESVSYEEKEEKERPESKGRFSILSSFRDKILTVIFDNQNRISQKLSMKTFNRAPKPKREKPKEDVYLKKNIAEIRAKVQRTHLYDKNLNVINKIYDDRKKAIKKLYNSDGKVIAELYSASGTLIKNSVLKNMFENNVFKPKAFNSEGNIITAIYTNDKHLKKVYDDKGEPAKLDSDLIYLVSELSLPREDIPGTSKSATKQVNYFSEGSSYPFPEGQNQKSQVNNQQLIEVLRIELFLHFL
ncbi:uncharacterized protein LOC123675779 isoform X2 [Harmonia axyridis]|uniref:uncharacterized protein LOC123675779 isoform X2 n=1 Tax=Harmonia axyridis TaxID=115357 RepID=UPI001E279870|nr:uncharacterized protein LOC123675779 isoform X2 [Harmonia axyridis]